MLLRMALLHSFLWLSSIPLYMCHSFFIHLSADAHLVCSHVFTVVNSAAMNTRAPISVQIIVFSMYMPQELGCQQPFFWLRWVFISACRLSPVAVHRLLIVVVSPVAGRRLQGAQASGGMVCRLSSFGSWAQLLCSMWDLPRPGIKLVSPALAGGFLSTVSTRKSCFCFLGEPLYFFPWWLQQFIFPPTMQKASLFSIPSPAFVICRLLNDGHQDWCKVAPLVVLICLFLIIIHDHLLT